MTRQGRQQRQRLLDVIRNDPGISVQRLARIADIGWTNCEHHMRTLEDKDLVQRRRIQGRWRIFATDAVSARDVEALGLLRDQRNRRIYEAVQERPGFRQIELAIYTGIPPSSLCRRLRLLDEQGLVRRRGRHHNVRVFPTETPPARPTLPQGGLFETEVSK